jgi:hypothetical protein
MMAQTVSRVRSCKGSDKSSSLDTENKSNRLA